ncbi:uncharacterized protein BDR25DRAFT_355670 [Lindgomyces ingoldianus]|uniref:Uncharacterized protein n=1 Tax=Lindgomyces ingoldianus TaxID=673940 RepID=A0ACB6QTU5_9PLEO|nr:uncharacterized protein BDR25DRAFT_355670 [Lindgomyces ingoldianus]KAF2469945.1 hypothetical protein BDR25DRAFT_355670 [Lindgomyces ingoldianus]
MPAHAVWKWRDIDQEMTQRTILRWILASIKLYLKMGGQENVIALWRNPYNQSHMLHSFHSFSMGSGCILVTESAILLAFSSGFGNWQVFLNVHPMVYVGLKRFFHLWARLSPRNSGNMRSSISIIPGIPTTDFWEILLEELSACNDQSKADILGLYINDLNQPFAPPRYKAQFHLHMRFSAENDAKGMQVTTVRDPPSTHAATRADRYTVKTNAQEQIDGCDGVR